MIEQRAKVKEEMHARERERPWTSNYRNYTIIIIGWSLNLRIC